MRYAAILAGYPDIRPQGITITPRCSDPIRRALYPPASTVQDMSLDHGRSDILVPQKLLNGPDIIAIFKEGEEKLSLAKGKDPFYLLCYILCPHEIADDCGGISSGLPGLSDVIFGNAADGDYRNFHRPADFP